MKIQMYIVKYFHVYTNVYTTLYPDAIVYIKIFGLLDKLGVKIGTLIYNFSTKPVNMLKSIILAFGNRKIIGKPLLFFFRF